MDEATICEIRINKNLTKIKHTLSPDIDPIIDRLIEKDVISSENKDKIYGETNSAKQVDEVLGIIRNRGPKAFDIFMDILLKTRHSDLHGIIMRTIIDPGRDAAYDRNASQSDDLMLAMKDMKAEMKYEASKTRQEVQQLKTQFEKFAGIKDEENEKLTDENKILKHEVSFLQEEIDKLGRDKAVDKSKIAELEAKYKDLRKTAARTDTIRKDNDALKRENIKMKREIQSLKDGLARLRAHLERHRPRKRVALPPLKTFRKK